MTKWYNSFQRIFLTERFPLSLMSGILNAFIRVYSAESAVERQLVIKLKKKYAAPLHLIKVNGSNDIYDCYIGVISGELLARIYKDEGQELIQKNVRSFLQATGKVNKGIKMSLASSPANVYGI